MATSVINSMATWHSVAAFQQQLLVQVVQRWMVSPTYCSMVLEILYCTVHLAAS